MNVHEMTDEALVKEWLGEPYRTDSSIRWIKRGRSSTPWDFPLPACCASPLESAEESEKVLDWLAERSESSLDRVALEYRLNPEHNQYEWSVWFNLHTDSELVFTTIWNPNRRRAILEAAVLARREESAP